MADVSSNLDSWSSTAASNSPSGGTSVGTGVDDNFRETQAVVRKYLATKGSDIASGTTVNMANATGNRIDVTHSSGTTAISSFGTLTAGMWKVVKFVISGGTLSLTHNATSMILPGGANITLATGDTGYFTSRGSGNWECNLFQRGDGSTLVQYLPLTGGTITGNTNQTGNNTITGALTLISTDAGASFGPVYTLYRNSVSPLANDIIGTIVYQAEDSAGNTQDYNLLVGQILDPTSGSEDSRHIVYTTVAGTTAERLYVGAGTYTAGATGGDQGANTINASAIYDDGAQILPILNETAITLSGASQTFPAIRAGVKSIKVAFSGASTASTGNILIRIGPSGGVESTGYTSGAGNQAGTAERSTVGFILRNAGTAGQAFSGVAVLTLLDNSANQTWAISGNIADSANDALRYFAGSKTITGTLGLVSVVAVGDTFDAGTVGLQSQ